MIETNRIEVTKGEPEPVATPSESGKGQTILRCPDCHVAVWSHYSGAKDKVAFVRVGTFDNPDLLPPDIHIFTESKQPWVMLPKDDPAYAKYYDWRKEWPEDAQARREAM